MFLYLPPNSRIYIAFYLWATKANHTSAFNQAAPGVVDAQDRAEGAGREQRGFGRERSFGTADFPFPRPSRPQATTGLSPSPPPGQAGDRAWDAFLTADNLGAKAARARRFRAGIVPAAAIAANPRIQDIPARPPAAPRPPC